MTTWVLVTLWACSSTLGCKPLELSFPSSWRGEFLACAEAKNTILPAWLRREEPYYEEARSVKCRKISE